MFLLPWKEHFQAVREVVSLLRKHKHLTWEMSKREITDRYTGQVLGSFWAIAHPLFMMGIYVFIFVFVFKVKVGGTSDLPLDYTTYLLSGLIPWLGFLEAMSKASVAITGNANLVKQFVFPIAILPIKGVIASLITQVIYVVLLVAYVLISHRSLPWTYLFLPVLIFVQFVGMVGVCYILSSVGAYFKDIKDIVQVFSLVGVYLMPIFYLPEQVPNLFLPILYLNPFSHLIWCYQDVLYFGRFEHPWSWLVFIILSHVTFTLGYRIFHKLETMFSHVL